MALGYFGEYFEASALSYRSVPEGFRARAQGLGGSSNFRSGGLEGMDVGGEDFEGLGERFVMSGGSVKPFIDCHAHLRLNSLLVT